MKKLLRMSALQIPLYILAIDTCIVDIIHVVNVTNLDNASFVGVTWRLSETLVRKFRKVFGVYVGPNHIHF